MSERQAFEMAAGAAAGELIVRQGDRVERLYGVATADRVWVFYNGRVFEIAAEAGSAHRRSARAQGSLMAPMPATVVAVNVAPGDTVHRGDVLIVLEAMKMELPVRSPGEGKVAAVHCRPGELVQPNISLVDLE